MYSYSSQQFTQDWRYAIEKDFTTADGQTFSFASDGQQHWGQELKKLSFAFEPHDACISGDSKRLAVATGKRVHIIDTESWETTVILRRQTSTVEGIGFLPSDSNILITGEAEYSEDGTEEEERPRIFVWNLANIRNISPHEAESLLGVGHVAAAAAAATLADLDISLTMDELHDLESSVASFSTQIVAKRTQPNAHILHGRLVTGFQSPIFSPSGEWMAYLPGKSPRSNDVDKWDINISSTSDFKKHTTLEGHTDAIMWIGWSPDESRIASVGWDKAVRIWDATTGEQLHRFHTDGQNWTGAFSPDSKYFAATCGQGSLMVYSLADGATHWRYESNGSSHWWRAMDWHPNSKWLAFGQEKNGQICILDIETKQVIQERVLSVRASKPDNMAVLKSLGRDLEVTGVKFVDSGRKLAIWTSGDGSIELYDLVDGLKWRFARGGTEDGPGGAEWRDENGKVTSGYGHGMVVWNDEKTGAVRLASIDCDGVRIWSVRLGPNM